MVIQCKSQNDPVTISVEVQGGSPIWNYDYQDRGTSYTGKVGDDKPHTHAIGFPHELNMITDSWTFSIVNPTQDAMAYNVIVKWLQQTDVIAEWHDEGEVPAGSVVYPFGDGIFLENAAATPTPGV